MGPIGVTEMIFIFVLALLIFGPKKLPELGRSFGKGVAEFRRASNELRSTFQREMDNIDRETSDVKEVAREVKQDVNSSYYDDTDDDYYSGYDSKPYKEGSSTSSTESATEGDSASDKAASDGEKQPVAASEAPIPPESSADNPEVKAS